MRHQGTIKTLLPVLAAIILLSLPATLNLSVRDKVSEATSFLWRALHLGKKELPTIDKSTEVKHILSHQKKMKEQAQAEVRALALQGVSVATVLFRSAHSWNSSLWIDIGQEDNPKEGPKIIGKNSPVLCGDSVVGVIDYVGKKASLVRLITDSGLTPSVRVARGAAGSAASYLAKGELQGHGEPLWRTPGKLLHGSGFQYDFKDSHGPARDLRTGAPIDPKGEYEPKDTVPLIQEGDLLVTSGLDGIFPEGLKIAQVHSISPLREGAFAYDLLAAPTAGDLLDLTYVFVLPPQKFSQEELPSATDLLIRTIED